MRIRSFCLLAGLTGTFVACSSTDDPPGYGVNTKASSSSATTATLSAASSTTSGSGGSGSDSTTSTNDGSVQSSAVSGPTTSGAGGDPTSGGAGGSTGDSTGGSGGASAGTGGAGTTGSGGSGGSQPTSDAGGGGDPSKNVNLVWKSSGCGKALPPTQVKTVPGSRTGYTEFHVQQTGATLAATDPSKAVSRQFWVRVPVDYDVNKAYRVVYITQGCGTPDAGRDATYPLFNEAQGGTEQAIYVAVSLPPNRPNNGCYDNRGLYNSQEWEAFQLFHDFVEARYCVDNNRIYTAGYSSGGWVSNMWGCYFAGIPTPPRKFAPNYALRGRASVTGGIIDGNPPCNGKIAGIWIHDAGDNTNVIAGSYAGRDSALKMNGCVGSPTMPWTGLPTTVGCVQYTACPKEYPIVFCTTQGQGHNDQATSAIPGFKKFFDMMNPL